LFVGTSLYGEIRPHRTDFLTEQESVAFAFGDEDMFSLIKTRLAQLICSYCTTERDYRQVGPAVG